MTVPFAKVSKQVNSVLAGAGYKVELFDENNNSVYNPEDAYKFFTHPDEIMISIHEDKRTDEDIKNKMVVSLSDNVDIEEFEKNIGIKLRTIANQSGQNMSYDIKSFGKVLEPKDFANQLPKIKEGSIMSMIEEGSKLTGTTKSSYQKVGECKVIIRHTDKIDETKFGARSRNINSIFVETKTGERFRVAENNLSGARAIARHLSNGGSPFDAIGLKINEMMGQMSKLREMAKQLKTFPKSAKLDEYQDFVSKLRTKNNTLRETLRLIAGAQGYSRFISENTETQTISEDVGVKPQFSNKFSSIYHDIQNFNAKQIVARAKSSQQFVKMLMDEAKLERESVSEKDIPDLILSKWHAGLNNLINRDYGQIDNAQKILLSLALKLTGHTETLSDLIALDRQNESVNEGITSETDKEDAEQEPLTIDTTDKDHLARCNAENMMSVNEAVLPEIRLFESWFDRFDEVEFFESSDLEKKTLDDHSVKTILPENALHTLNMYVGHPLFHSYVRLYDKQGILETVVSLVEENSKLHSLIQESQKLVEFDSQTWVDIDQAYNELAEIMSSNSIGFDQAIEEIATKYTQDNPAAYQFVINELTQRADNSGLAKHDFGSSFNNDVMTPQSDIRTKKDEIENEMYYGDARFMGESEVCDVCNHEPCDCDSLKEDENDQELNPNDAYEQDITNAVNRVTELVNNQSTGNVDNIISKVAERFDVNPQDIIDKLDGEILSKFNFDDAAGTDLDSAMDTIDWGIKNNPAHNGFDEGVGRFRQLAGLPEGNIIPFKPKDTRSDMQKYMAALQGQMGDEHRAGAGYEECKYCGDIACDYDCDESQANGFTEAKGPDADPHGGSMISPPGNEVSDEDIAHIKNDFLSIVDGELNKTKEAIEYDKQRGYQLDPGDIENMISDAISDAIGLFYKRDYSEYGYSDPYDLFNNQEAEQIARERLKTSGVLNSGVKEANEPEATDVQKDAPYGVYWSSSYEENYGDVEHPHWKSKGDYPKIVGINIPTYAQAQELANTIDTDAKNGENAKLVDLYDNPMARSYYHGATIFSMKDINNIFDFYQEDPTMYQSTDSFKDYSMQESEENNEYDPSREDQLYYRTEHAGIPVTVSNEEALEELFKKLGGKVIDVSDKGVSMQFKSSIDAQEFKRQAQQYGASFD